MRVVLIAADYRVANLRLQPWRFLSEVANGLSELGHRTTVVSDVGPDKAPPGTVSVRSVRLPASGNAELEQRIRDLCPDVCLWNFGLSSVLHFAAERVRWPSIAMFTSPIYTASSLLRLGFERLWLSRDYALVHVAGSTVSASRLRKTLSAFRAVIVQSQATLDGLQSRGVATNNLHLVRPGIDDEFRSPLPRLESQAGPFVVGYMGSPLPVRGVLDLVGAAALARNRGLDVRLRILSRNNGAYEHQEHRLLRHIARGGHQDMVTLKSGYLNRAQLIDELASTHLIALPFQIVPSDAPLAVLEAMALGRPILGTRVASITEYLADGRGYLADPGNPQSLSQAILDAADGEGGLDRVRDRALAYAGDFVSWQEVSAKVSQIVSSDPRAEP